MRPPGKIHYGAPAHGVWQPMCGAKPKGANCTPLSNFVQCERCKTMMAACESGASR